MVRGALAAISSPFALRTSRAASMARGTACEWPGKKSAKTKKKKVKNQKSARHLVGSAKKRKKRTIHNILDLVEAGSQLCLPVGPGGALALELGQECSLFLIYLLLRLLEQLLLLRQLRSQQITLHDELAALILLGAQGGVGLAQLLLKSGVGL